MKTTALVVAFAASSLFAQECPYSKQAKAQAECTAQSQATNSVVKAFQALKPEAKKAVTEALAGLSKTCPMGKRMPKTVAALDKLYAQALTSMQKVRKNEAIGEGLAKDLDAHIRMVKRLSALNSECSETFKSMLANASCCDSAKKACDSAKSCDSAKAVKDVADLGQVEEGLRLGQEGLRLSEELRLGEGRQDVADLGSVEEGLRLGQEGVRLSQELRLGEDCQDVADLGPVEEG